MGATLDIAAGMGAYALADRATWIAFANKRGHRVLVEGDARLFNRYGIVAVSKARHPGVKADLARRFVDWMLSAEGQAAIASFRIGGRHLFFPTRSGRGGLLYAPCRRCSGCGKRIPGGRESLFIPNGGAAV